MVRRLALAAFAVMSLAVPAVAQAPFAPEPAALWPGPMQGATPRTLAGATVLDVEGLAALISQPVGQPVGHERPVLIDVANAEPLPAGSPAAQWAPVHRTIPGALWLPGAGTGKDRPGFAEAFAERVRAATGGDRETPVAVFCHARRWGSWNAAKRLAALGYAHVYWYPGGSEGWADQGPLRAVVEDPAWRGAGFDASSAGDRPDAAAPGR